MLFGCGFFGILLYQLTGLGYVVPLVVSGLLSPVLEVIVTLVVAAVALLQGLAILQSTFIILALGAPAFEEFFKVGLALVLLSPFASTQPAGNGLRIARVVVAAAVGTAFGWSEHFLYSQESDLDYAFRVAFHGASSALSMVLYNILESGSDRRIRWFAAFPAAFAHYLNNGAGVVLSIVFCSAGNCDVAVGWSYAIVVVLVLAIPAFAFLGSPVRRLAERQAAKRFGVPPPSPVLAATAGARLAP